MGGVDPQVTLAFMIVIFLGVGLHEYAHCKFADLAGDPTPRLFGRVTLNLTKHFEPTGTMMMVISSLTGLGIGWGRPAPMDQRKMRNPRVDFFIAVVAGPMSNLAQAVIYAGALRFLLRDGLAGSNFVSILMTVGVTSNLAMCFFNLIPFGPLDGHWLVGELLPEKQRFYWYRFHHTIGMSGLLIVMVVLGVVRNIGGPSVMSTILWGPVARVFEILVGAPSPFR